MGHSFDDVNVQAGFRQEQCRRQPTRSRADDDDGVGATGGVRGGGASGGEVGSRRDHARVRGEVTRRCGAGPRQSTGLEVSANRIGGRGDEWPLSRLHCSTATPDQIQQANVAPAGRSGPRPLR
ncbi:hypothetical protein FTUN_7585 [Frigoriglobus tundricola]|uniref:Uncharacterized protein n=1 Tax=Frigoriglobus tundricola TaxID=2774151 RepID=A0A6M5Z429_9BACT|nr:hypothetical protein FTUN_7585 [Frigoriglobus tundricola]